MLHNYAAQKTNAAALFMNVIQLFLAPKGISIAKLRTDNIYLFVLLVALSGRDGVPALDLSDHKILAHAPHLTAY